jgi:hypothetical protein
MKQKHYMSWKQCLLVAAILAAIIAWQHRPTQGQDLTVGDVKQEMIHNFGLIHQPR